MRELLKERESGDEIVRQRRKGTLERKIEEMKGCRVWR